MTDDLIMDKLQFPPYLNKGDKVMIISPSGKIDKKLLSSFRKQLESLGLKVVMGKHAGSDHERFAGTTRQRLEDLQRALSSPDIKAVFCSRGGYGAIHLVDKVDFSTFHKAPKWLIGYSDITLLHELFQYNGYASIHAPMARHHVIEAKDDYCTQSLHNILVGEIPQYECEGHKLNRSGNAQGILRGGNLSVLYSMRGTKFDFPSDNTILFLEDIGERPYHIDRMIQNLKLGGKLENLSGLMVGQFTEFEKDKSIKEVYELIADSVKEYSYPVCFNFPVGHVPLNVPLICGANAEFTVTKKKVKLKTFAPDNNEEKE